MNTMLLQFWNFALKPEVCKMGGNFRLQTELNLICKVKPNGPRPKRRILWYQLDALYDFQNLYLVFGKCDV